MAAFFCADRNKLIREAIETEKGEKCCLNKRDEMLWAVGEFLPVEDPVKLLSHRGQISSPVHINRPTAYNKQYKKKYAHAPSTKPTNTTYKTPN